MCFYYPWNQAKNPWHYLYNEQKTILKGRKKKAAWLGTLGLRRAVNSLGFLFAAYTPRLGAREADNSGIPGADYRCPKEGELSSQRTRKGSAKQDRKLWDSNCPTPTNRCRKNCSPTYTSVSKGRFGIPDFHLPHVHRWTDLKTVEYLFHEILLSNKTGWTIACSNMDKSQNNWGQTSVHFIWFSCSHGELIDCSLVLSSIVKI